MDLAKSWGRFAAIFLAGFIPALALDPYAMAIHSAVHSTLYQWLWIEEIFQALREFGALAGGTLILLMAAALDPPRRRWILRAAAAVALSYLASQSGKVLSGRFRPHEERGAYAFTGPLEDWLDDRRKSFPSGHAACAFALASALGRIYPRGSRGLHAIAGGCALSRVLDARHFPSDVYAGACLGIACARLLLPRAPS